MLSTRDGTTARSAERSAAAAKEIKTLIATSDMLTFAVPSKVLGRGALQATNADGSWPSPLPWPSRTSSGPGPTP